MGRQDTGWNRDLVAISSPLVRYLYRCFSFSYWHATLNYRGQWSGNRRHFDIIYKTGRSWRQAAVGQRRSGQEEPGCHLFFFCNPVSKKQRSKDAARGNANDRLCQCCHFPANEALLDLFKLQYLSTCRVLEDDRQTSSPHLITQPFKGPLKDMWSVLEKRTFDNTWNSIFAALLYDSTVACKSLLSWGANRITSQGISVKICGAVRTAAIGQRGDRHSCGLSSLGRRCH